MRVNGGPIDGADVPRHSREFLMVTFYDDGNPDEAQNYVYRQDARSWEFEPRLTNAGRNGMRDKGGAS